jgi:DNA polymerase
MPAFNYSPSLAPSTAATQPHVLFRDYETRSRLDLKRVGAFKYAADPSTEVLCCAYAVDDGPVQLWKWGDPLPPEFIEAEANPDWWAVAHNAQFEMTIEQYLLAPRLGWPVIPLERQRCTQALCQMHALPGKLELAAEALCLANQKDRAGHRLMLMMSKPRRPHRDEDAAGTYWFEDEARLQRLYEYAKQDLEVERELWERLQRRPLPPAEQLLWQLDAKINQRGFHVDRELAEAARAVARAAGPEIDAELAAVTGGAVTGVNQTARLKSWAGTHGCTVPSLAKKQIEDLLADELPARVRRALELRQSGAQAAAKKIEALLTCYGTDIRARGLLRYHGASTGRWTSNNFQPQNLKHPETEDIDAAIAAISTGNYQIVRQYYARPLAVVGDISRSLVCAAPGHVLVGADYSAIESRVLAWVAGENWKLDTYRRFDATQDPRDHPYCITACTIFRVPNGSYDDKSPERKVGKTCDVAFGYQGGVGAWRKFEPGLYSDQEVEQFKLEWRAPHPAIREFWYAIDRATWQAVRERGRVIRCGRILCKCDGMFLQIKLPSGRKLSYPYPRIEIEDLRHEVVVFKDGSAGRWRDCRAYGGLWTENIVQAISRDLLAEAMIWIEAAGYPIVLHVHDEIVAEVPDGFGRTEEFTKLMIQSPSWALGLPIAATSWTGKRFRK